MGASPDIGAKILFCQHLHPDMQRPQALSSAHTFTGGLLSFCRVGLLLTCTSSVQAPFQPDSSVAGGARFRQYFGWSDAPTDSVYSRALLTLWQATAWHKSSR